MPAARAQEIPARFLSVTQWFGTFSRTLTANGTDTVGGCAAAWNYSDNCVVNDRLLPQFLFPPSASWMGTNGIISQGVNLSESDSLDCPDGSSYWLRGSGGHVEQGFTLVIDTSQNTYTLYVPGLELDITTSYGITQPETAAWYNGTITGPLPGSGLVISGTNSEQLPGLNGTTFIEGVSPKQTNALLQLGWTLTPFLEQDELVVHVDDYQTWLPEGNLQDQTKRGNDLTVSALLQKKGGGATTAKAQKFTFALANVSHEPGVCMNFPSAAVASTGPDFKFEAELNQSPPLLQPLNLVDSFTAETTGPPATNANADVSCFDYGAYATIQVTALVNGSNIVGYLDVDPTQTPGPIPLPRRAATSFVADFWKESNGATDLASNDDSEQDPIGDTHQGDGFTLYEEYRGFSVNGQHTRLNPKKKDLFVLNEAGADGDVGIAVLASVSGLQIHQVKGTEFGLQPDFSYSRILNFNHSASAPHVVDQHGIWVVVGESSIGFSEAENLEGFDNNSTPGTKARARLDPGLTGTVGRHVVGTDGVIYLQPKPKISETASTAAHEIAHCCSVYHHGNDDTQDAVVLGGADSNGQYRITIDGVLGSDTVLHENGAPFEPSVGSTYYIGQQHGTHSGNESCFMRYDYSQGYASHTDPSVIYLLDDRELSGFTLCTSATGTGVNAPAPGVPWPRYGDADSSANRDGCLWQTCVNDVYASDPRHNR